MEHYYLVKRVKDCFMIDAFNSNILKQKGGELGMLSSEVIKPREIGVQLNEKGEIFCADKDYKMKEITKKEAINTLDAMKKNYSLWQNHMSIFENISSPNLVGFGGESL